MDKDLCYAAAPYDNEFNDLRHLLAGITRGLYGFFGKVGTPRDKVCIAITCFQRGPATWIVERSPCVQSRRESSAQAYSNPDGLDRSRIAPRFNFRHLYNRQGCPSDGCCCLFSALLIIAMSSFTKTKTVELFISGAT